VNKSQQTTSNKQRQQHWGQLQHWHNGLLLKSTFPASFNVQLLIQPVDTAAEGNTSQLPAA
jgi:hypothetical protein